MQGQELKKIREELGMTQAEFGAIFGYHQAQIRMCEFEKGVRKIPERVARGCDYLRKEKSRKALNTAA